MNIKKTIVIDVSIGKAGKGCEALYWLHIGPIGVMISLRRLTSIGQPGTGRTLAGSVFNRLFFWKWRELGMIGLGPLVIIQCVATPAIYACKKTWLAHYSAYLHSDHGRDFGADLQWALAAAYEEDPTGWTWEKNVNPKLRKRGYQHTWRIQTAVTPQAGPDRPYSSL